MILIQAAAGGPGYMNIVMLVGILGVMYFFMIRPQQKKAKEQQAFIDGIKEGDKVVSIGGQHGKIIAVRDKTFVVEVDSAKGVRVVFEKSSISKDASNRLGE